MHVSTRKRVVHEESRCDAKVLIQIARRAPEARDRLVGIPSHRAHVPREERGSKFEIQYVFTTRWMENFIGNLLFQTKANANPNPNLRHAKKRRSRGVQSVPWIKCGVARAQIAAAEADVSKTRFAHARSS